MNQHKRRIDRLVDQLDTDQKTIMDKYITGAPERVLVAIVDGWEPPWQQIVTCDYGSEHEPAQKTD